MSDACPFNQPGSLQHRLPCRFDTALLLLLLNFLPLLPAQPRPCNPFLQVEGTHFRVRMGLECSQFSGDEVALEADAFRLRDAPAGNATVLVRWRPRPLSSCCSRMHARLIGRWTCPGAAPVPGPKVSHGLSHAGEHRPVGTQSTAPGCYALRTAGHRMDTSPAPATVALQDGASLGAANALS